MALSPAQWETQVDARPNGPELRKQIMWTDARGVKKFPEGGDKGWRHNDLWQTLLRIFMASEFSTENIDFLEDVDAFKSGTARAGQPAPPTAQQLEDAYLADGAPRPINLPAPKRARLRAALKGEDAVELRAALDEADLEITLLTGQDPYARLKKELSDVVQPAWAAAADAGKAEVGVPKGAASPQRPPTTDEVIDWNTEAVQALRRNTATDFFQLGELVLVANPAARVPPPGIGWLQQQQGVVTGKITKQGGVFGDASIRAEGVKQQDRVKFEDAIRFVFDKGRIDFSAAPEKPAGSKPSVFRRG